MLIYFSSGGAGGFLCGGRGRGFGAAPLVDSVASVEGGAGGGVRVLGAAAGFVPWAATARDEVPSRDGRDDVVRFDGAETALRPEKSGPGGRSSPDAENIAVDSLTVTFENTGVLPAP